jgi:hypothetical protein
MDTSTILLLLILGAIAYYVLRLERREPFTVKVKRPNYYTLYRPETYKEPLRNDFNIDNMIKLNPETFGWKSYWRQYQSASTIPEESFEISNNITQPLLYDGIKKVECT